MHWLHVLRPRRRMPRALCRPVAGCLGCIIVSFVHAKAQAAAAPDSKAPVPFVLETSAQLGLRASTDLPDSPGTIMRRTALADSAEATNPDSSAAPVPVSKADQSAEAAKARASDAVPPRPCSTPSAIAGENSSASASSAGPPPPVAKPVPPCPPTQNPYQRFLNSSTPIPLSARQKGYLAVHNFIDPGNLITIIGTSGIAIASDAHTAYGPGWRGFGRDAGISAVEDATGDFFGTFLIPAIAHEDPHYHRRPNASIPMRTLHAISRTIIAQGDDGHAMLNYATLLTYPITAEIANLYVPGIASNGPATVQRVLTGYATDPIDNLITEFLPDVAKRVHVRVIFVQQIINQVAAGQPISMFP